MVLLIISLVLLITSVIIIINLKLKEKKLSKQVDDLNSYKNDYEKFKQEIKESFNNSLKKSFKLIIRVNTFELNNKKKLNIKEIKDIKEFVYGSSNNTAFEASIDVLESLYSEIGSFIKKNYSELNETEYKVCVLSIAPLNIEDIANIIELGIDSVGKARSNIRKKIKIVDKKKSISEYILEKYYQRNV